MRRLLEVVRSPLLRYKHAKFTAYLAINRYSSGRVTMLPSPMEVALGVFYRDDLKNGLGSLRDEVPVQPSSIWSPIDNYTCECIDEIFIRGISSNHSGYLWMFIGSFCCFFHIWNLICFLMYFVQWWLIWRWRCSWAVSEMVDWSSACPRLCRKAWRNGIYKFTCSVSWKLHFDNHIILSTPFNSYEICL